MLSKKHLLVFCANIVNVALWSNQFQVNFKIKTYRKAFRWNKKPLNVPTFNCLLLLHSWRSWLAAWGIMGLRGWCRMYLKYGRATLSWPFLHDILYKYFDVLETLYGRRTHILWIWNLIFHFRRHYTHTYSFYAISISIKNISVHLVSRFHIQFCGKLN